MRRRAMHTEFHTELRETIQMIQTIVVGSQFVKISINPQNHSGQLDQVNRDNSTRGRRSSHGDEI